jgi:CubicO group peptidase (beta-lactamase class C family)
MKRFLKYFIATLLAIACWTVIAFFGTKLGCMHTPISSERTTEAFTKAVSNELEKEFVGNFALAIIEDGEVISETFHTAGKPVSRNTVFQVASLSKWVSAIGIMKLVERGNIDLDTPVSQYLTRWALPESEFNNDSVTVRRLLSHTAGLTDRLGYSGFAPGTPIQNLEESLTKAADADEGIKGAVMVGIEPGSEFKYSGGGYTLLQLIIEEVTNQSFATYMKEEVLNPLGMTASSYVWDDSSKLDLAEFYHADGAEAVHYRYTALAATSLYTSLADLESLFNVFLKGANNEPIGRGVLNPETLKAMRSPHASTMGMDIWGLGTILYTTTDNGDYIFGHDGKSTPSINTAIRLNPETGNGIIVLETGHPILATKLASEWVFWKEGKVDLTLFTLMKDQMVSTILIGWLVIFVSAILIGFLRRKKSPNL